MTEMWIYRIPIWLLFLIIVAIVMVSIGIGFLGGQRSRRRKEHEGDSPAGSAVGALLGLLAFLLAFTFNAANSRFEDRKQLLLDEVNAIGAADMHAQLLPEPHRIECRQLLKRYVNIRLQAVSQPERIPEFKIETEDIFNKLWSHIIALTEADLNPRAVGLFTASLDKVLEINTLRVMVTIRYHIHWLIWCGLFSITILAMAAIGYQFGLSGSTRFTVLVLLALGFSIVVSLIADLDHSTHGNIKVSHEPMIMLQQKMER